jgi:hypothetical protein
MSAASSECNFSHLMEDCKSHSPALSANQEYPPFSSPRMGRRRSFEANGSSFAWKAGPSATVCACQSPDSALTIRPCSRSVSYNALLKPCVSITLSS